MWTGQPGTIHQPSGGNGAHLPLLLSMRGQLQPASRAFCEPGFGRFAFSPGISLVGLLLDGGEGFIKLIRDAFTGAQHSFGAAAALVDSRPKALD